jgi:RNA polymerase sigma factor (sigma-70 family)
MKRHRIILADDHIILRRGLRMILETRNDFEVVAEVGDGLELLQLLNHQVPEVIVLDISMPKLRGIEAIPEIKRAHFETKILVLTMHRDEEFMRQAIAAGADGYLLKEDADKDLFSAIDTILQGRIYVSPFLSAESMRDWSQLRQGKKILSSFERLTNREREVLKLITEGKSSKEIGDLLHISVRTVERHRANLMEKLHAKRTADLVKYAVRQGYA